MSEGRAVQLRLRPRARVVASAVVGSDPILMHTGSVAVTARVLERARLTLEDMDVVEVNESHAAVLLAWARQHHADLARVNVNGGAIALGHPVGCSGARMLATLVAELERARGRYGLQVMAAAGGMGTATVLERLG
jgi:acetyl-CoA acetyltransferase